MINYSLWSTINFNVLQIPCWEIPLHNWLLWENPSFNLQATPLFDETALEQQRTNLRLIMAESTTLNAASSPQLMEGLTWQERV